MNDLAKIRQAEIDYCASHIVYFVETYGHIEDRNSEEIIQKFTLWPDQKKALEDMLNHKWTIVLKARQLGISWLVLHYAAWLNVTHYGKSVIGLSRTEEEAKELVRRMCVILRNMPALVREKGNTTGWDGAWFESSAMKVTIHFPGHADSVFQCFNCYRQIL